MNCVMDWVGAMKSDVLRSRSAALAEMEQIMRGFPQIECPVEHEFADGIYRRKMFAPAGALVLGKRHRHRTLNILLAGSVTVYAGDSLPVLHLTAPATFTSDAMTRKLLLFHEDSVFANIHPTTETDPELIEQACVVTEEEFINLLEKGGE